MLSSQKTSRFRGKWHADREDFASGSDVPVVIDGVKVGRIAVAGILG